jgi:carbamoyl-phosphate synthase large subunit
VHKVSEGSPSVVDLLEGRKVDFLINTPLGKNAQVDDGQIRKAALKNHIPYTTTIPAAFAAAGAIEAMKDGPLAVASLQQYHGL